MSRGRDQSGLDKKVTSSDDAPVIGELAMVTDGDKEGADGSYVELGPDKQWVQIDLGAAADSTPWSSGTITVKPACITT